MHDLPLAHDLLAIARASLLDELLPHLPAAQKYTALMVANAMVIAGREQAAAEPLMQARQALLQQAGECMGHPMDGRQLCQALREGALDAELIALLPALRADVQCRLQVGNPRYLESVQALASQEGAACPN